MVSMMKPSGRLFTAYLSTVALPTLTPSQPTLTCKPNQKVVQTAQIPVRDWVFYWYNDYVEFVTTMLDLFDLLTPRVVVVSEKSYKERKRKALEDKKARYTESMKLYENAITEIDKALEELVD